MITIIHPTNCALILQSWLLHFFVPEGEFLISLWNIGYISIPG